MSVYKDTAGVWHISTSGRDFPASVNRLDLCLTDFEPFTISGNNFRGEIGQPVFNGDVPARYQIDPDKSTYVVRSFGIPIAWYVPAYGETPNTWHIPIVHYSLPSTRHQRMIRRSALARLSQGFVILS